MEVCFWVEGKADQKFLADVICEWFNGSITKIITTKPEVDGQELWMALNAANTKIKILTINGVQNILGVNAQKLKIPFQLNSQQGITNVVIIDADNNPQLRKSEIAATRNLLGEHFPCFLFPDDNATGDLETVLETIINTAHQSIFNCWNSYELCLSNANPNYTIPAKKTKIYAYLEALHGTSNNQKEKLKELNRSYRNPDHWILDPEQKPILQPLKTFLRQHLQIEQ